MKWFLVPWGPPGRRLQEAFNDDEGRDSVFGFRWHQSEMISHRAAEETEVTSSGVS